MKVKYDKKANAVYIEIKKGKIRHSIPINILKEEGSYHITLDEDIKRNILGIEIIDFNNK